MNPLFTKIHNEELELMCACKTSEKLNDSRKNEILLIQLAKHVKNIDRILCISRISILFHTKTV